MKDQCRTCGEWYPESEMYATDYGDDGDMVCEGCYDSSYGKCDDCGAIREAGHLIKGVCNRDIVDHEA